MLVALIHIYQLVFGVGLAGRAKEEQRVVNIYTYQAVKIAVYRGRKHA